MYAYIYVCLCALFFMGRGKGLIACTAIRLTMTGVSQFGHFLVFILFMGTSGVFQRNNLKSSKMNRYMDRLHDCLVGKEFACMLTCLGIEGLFF